MSPGPIGLRSSRISILSSKGDREAFRDLAENARLRRLFLESFSILVVRLGQKNSESVGKRCDLTLFGSAWTMTSEKFYAHALLAAFRSRETADAIRPLRLKARYRPVWGMFSIRDHEP